MKKSGLGFSYRVPDGCDDPTKDPTIMRFVMRMGNFVLDQLLQIDENLGSVAPPTEAELHALAGEIIQSLEAKYEEDIQLEPENEYLKKLGQRHGPHFSRVVEA